MAEQENLISQDPTFDQPVKEEPNQSELGKSEQAAEIAVDRQQTETDFAIQLVETLVSLNNDEISTYEAINRFTTKAELSCLIIFARSIPLSPIAAVYPENAFLIFKGVALPKSVNLTQQKLTEVEERIMSSNDISNDNLHLLDLPPEMLNAFEIAVTIYNGKAEKIRTSYLAAVKNAKSQVIEVSAAVICVSIIIITAVALLTN
jgi:hypothetical protein